MAYFVVTDDGGVITELYTDEEGYAPPPDGAIPISDEEGEVLRRGFANRKLVNGVVVENTEALLAEARQRKIAEIEAERDAACFANVSALGYTWQADKRSQDLLGQEINLAGMGLPLTPVWRDADNNNMAVSSVDDLLAIAAAIKAQTLAAYAHSWELKALVDAAEDVAALHEVAW